MFTKIFFTFYRKPVIKMVINKEGTLKYKYSYIYNDNRKFIIQKEVASSYAYFDNGENIS